MTGRKSDRDGLSHRTRAARFALDLDLDRALALALDRELIEFSEEVKLYR